MRREHEQSEKRFSPRRRMKNSKATKKVADFLEWKRDLVAEVWSSNVNNIQLSVENLSGNYRIKSTQVSGILGVAIAGQLFVRGRREIRQRTVAKYTMDFIHGCDFITVNQKKEKKT